MMHMALKRRGTHACEAVKTWTARGARLQARRITCNLGLEIGVMRAPPAARVIVAIPGVEAVALTRPSAID
jgi:hypothetical protein